MVPEPTLPVGGKDCVPGHVRGRRPLGAEREDALPTVLGPLLQGSHVTDVYDATLDTALSLNTSR